MLQMNRDKKNVEGIFRILAFATSRISDYQILNYDARFLNDQRFMQKMSNSNMKS